MNQQATREYHIDNIKGILIFLVVLGHLLGYLQEIHVSFATGVRTFIYFFHMPGFIFMSGYLAKGFLQKQYKAEKLLSFAWLYLLFKDSIELVHFIFKRPYFENAPHPAAWLLIVLLFCGGIWLLSFAHHHSAPFRKVFFLCVVGISLVKTDILTVGAAPWYLLALILWHCTLYLTKNMKPKYVLTGAVLLAAVINYQESVGKFLTLSRALNFLPFFLLGYYIRKEQLAQILNHPKCKRLLPTLFLFSAFLIIPFWRWVQKCWGVFFFGVSPYSKLGSPLYPFAPLLCVLWMAVVLLLLFGLFILCPRKETFLCRFGKNTLGIYILHRLFKDFLIYGGFYEILSPNEFLAVPEVMLVSLLLTCLFGTAFWANTIKRLSQVSVRRFYR